MKLEPSEEACWIAVYAAAVNSSDTQRARTAAGWADDAAKGLRERRDAFRAEQRSRDVIAVFVPIMQGGPELPGTDLPKEP